MNIYKLLTFFMIFDFFLDVPVYYRVWALLKLLLFKRKKFFVIKGAKQL